MGAEQKSVTVLKPQQKLPSLDMLLSEDVFRTFEETRKRLWEEGLKNWTPPEFLLLQDDQGSLDHENVYEQLAKSYLNSPFCKEIPFYAFLAIRGIGQMSNWSAAKDPYYEGVMRVREIV